MATQDFYGGVIFGVAICIVVSLVIALIHEYNKIKNPPVPAPDNKINDVVVDAISLEMDVWNCQVTVALLIDTKWKTVADIDFAKLQEQNLPLGPRLIRSTTPINTVKSRKTPLVFGGYT